MSDAVESRSSFQDRYGNTHSPDFSVAPIMALERARGVDFYGVVYELAQELADPTDEETRGKRLARLLRFGQKLLGNMTGMVAFLWEGLHSGDGKYIVNGEQWDFAKFSRSITSKELYGAMMCAVMAILDYLPQGGGDSSDPSLEEVAAILGEMSSKQQPLQGLSPGDTATDN